MKSGDHVVSGGVRGTVIRIGSYIRGSTPVDDGIYVDWRTPAATLLVPNPEALPERPV